MFLFNLKVKSIEVNQEKIKEFETRPNEIYENKMFRKPLKESLKVEDKLNHINGEQFAEEDFGKLNLGMDNNKKDKFSLQKSVEIPHFNINEHNLLLQNTEYEN